MPRHPHLDYPGTGPRPVPDTGRKRGRPRASSLASSDAVGDMVRDSSAVAKVLSHIASGVNYSDFLAADPPIGANVFLDLRGLALLDTFMELDDGDISGKLDILPGQLAGLRAHAHYDNMVERLRASASSLAAATSIDGMAAAGERQVAAELFHMAMHGKTSRDQLKAIEALADRRSSKKTREPEQRVLSFPEGLMEFMKLALEMTGRQSEPRTIGAGEPAIEILADRLNVPVHRDEP